MRQKRFQISLNAIYFCKDVAGSECCRIFDPTNKQTMKVETTANGNQVRTELLFNMPKVTPYVTDEHKMGYIYSVHSYPSYPNMLYVSKREYNNCGHFSGYNHLQFPIEKASSFDMQYISKLVSQVV